MTPPTVTWLGMTRQHYQAGTADRIRALVVHATAGSHPGDLDWLRKGGDEKRPISVHYYIDKAGRISQLVRDADIAWHAGRSTWPVDGQVVNGLNGCSLGIELENRNDGRDPYPAAQVTSLVALSRALVERYQIPRDLYVRHLDISPGRKTDPAGLNWPAVVARVFPAAYSPNSPILGQSLATPAQALAFIRKRPHGAYTDEDLQLIVRTYAAICAETEVDLGIAIAQLVHETGTLTSWWSQRPRRNPAGIGVTGDTEPGTARLPVGPGWAWDGQIWREGVSFPSWADHAIPAHIGRLLAYALSAGEEHTLAQDAYIAAALRVRPLPARYRGAAPTLAGLVGTWAVPGWKVVSGQRVTYADKLAAIANLIASQPL